MSKQNLQNTINGMEYATLVILNPINNNNPTPLVIAIAADITPPMANNGRERTHEHTQHDNTVYIETTTKHGPNILKNKLKELRLDIINNVHYLP